MLGQTASFPFRADVRGSLAVADNDSQIIVESLRDLIETRQGERLMMPDYGLPDIVFDPLSPSFGRIFGAMVAEQAGKYITAVERVEVDETTVGAHSAEIRILFWRRNRKLPQELLYPTWRLNFNARN